MSAQPRSQAAGDLVAWAAECLGPASESPRLDAEILLAASAGIGRAALYAEPRRVVAAADAARLTAAVRRRRLGEPLAYITGRREFYSLELAVDPAVLVPRPETEILVECALAALDRGPVSQREPSRPTALRVLDLGTGSGAIALALKSQRPALEVTAVDRSAAALAVASANALALGLAIRWVDSDWFSALANERFDLIVANPPYVASGDPHFGGALQFEPREALDGGPDGLAAFRAIVDAAAEHLVPGGSLWLEHGHDQRDRLTSLAAAAGFRRIGAVEDLAGLPRVIGLARGVDG